VPHLKNFLSRLRANIGPVYYRWLPKVGTFVVVLYQHSYLVSTSSLHPQWIDGNTHKDSNMIHIVRTCPQPITMQKATSLSKNTAQPCIHIPANYVRELPSRKDSTADCTKLFTIPFQPGSQISRIHKVNGQSKSGVPLSSFMDETTSTGCSGMICPEIGWWDVYTNGPKTWSLYSRFLFHPLS
jgi:hypothetical protein